MRTTFLTTVCALQMSVPVGGGGGCTVISSSDQVWTGLQYSIGYQMSLAGGGVLYGGEGGRGGI